MNNKIKETILNKSVLKYKSYCKLFHTKKYYANVASPLLKLKYYIRFVLKKRLRAVVGL